MGSSSRGLASMSKQRRIEIAKKGARKLHKQGKSHVFTSDEAKKAALDMHAKKRAARVQMSAINLIRAGFKPAQLAGLTEADFLYYGDKRQWPDRLGELAFFIKNSVESTASPL